MSNTLLVALLGFLLLDAVDTTVLSEISYFGEVVAKILDIVLNTLKVSLGIVSCIILHKKIYQQFKDK